MRASSQLVKLLRRCARLIGTIGVTIAALLVATGSAAAGCMAAPAPELRVLADLAGRNPSLVLAATRKDAVFTAGDSVWAWRLAARGKSFDVLSQAAKARATVMQVIESGSRLSLSLRVELIVRAAMNGLEPARVERFAKALPSVSLRSPLGRAVRACVEIALGEAYRYAGAPERAVAHLAWAYRMTQDPSGDLPHFIATEKLARVMDAAGDHQQAIALVEEVIAWDEAHGRSVALSNDFYFRGSFHLARGAYETALADFDRSRALAPPAMDPVGSAYLDLQTCATLIELQRLAAARTMCSRAEAAFDAAGEPARGQAWLLLAGISYREGHSAPALELLDRLLANPQLLSSFASAPKAYRLRSDVNRELGRTEAAYRDLARYVRMDERRSAYERSRQNAVLRASVEADRAAARNEELNRSLRLSREREGEQSRRYRQLAWSAAVGIVMLATMLAMGVSHRRRLFRLANTDPLTGLPNRRFLFERERAIFTSGGSAVPSSTIALLDIDHFKSINDTHGHDAGDEVLKWFAEVLRSSAGRCDMVARWGGEEFVLLLPNDSVEQVLHILDAIRCRLSNWSSDRTVRSDVRFSAGVASFQPGDTLQTIIRRADRALYRAKAKGRDRFEVEGGPCAAPREHPNMIVPVEAIEAAI